MSPEAESRIAGDSALWQEAAAMAALHSCRVRGELNEVMQGEVARLFPGASAVLWLAADGEAERVEMTVGDVGPWQVGDEVTAAASDVPAGQRFPIRYLEHVLGELLVCRPLDESERSRLSAMVAHYGVALVNLTLDEEARQDTENYCASLLALEEGVVLFQEEDPEAIQARLLSLASSMMHATAAALYVLRQVGDPDSGLELVQTLGIPAGLLADFRSRDGTAWPERLLALSAHKQDRDAAGNLGDLAAEGLPPVLHNIVTMPLRYHGIDAGLCVLFNSAIEEWNSKEHLGRAQSLGQLGAALLHRVQLEALAAENRTIARELQIAEAIQKRLIPSRAPPTDDFEFAWSSVAARYIGGDYLDLVASDLGDIYAVVADVSGHGINSALLMSSFRSTYRGDAPWSETSSLAGLLNQEVVHEVGDTGMFITAVMMRLECATKEITLTSAGHNPVLVHRAASGQVEQIDSHGPPLGFVAGAEYEDEARSLATGDVVLLYTDGVTEATDHALEMFGEDRLIATLRAHAAASAEDIVGAVRAALNEFTRRETLEDDVSLLVIKAR